MRLSNRPNPFGQGTSIEYRLPAPAHVRITIFDLAGRRVRNLVDDPMPLGPHAKFWDGRTEGGQKAGSGTYVIKLSLDGKVVATRRTTLIR